LRCLYGRQPCLQRDFEPPAHHPCLGLTQFSPYSSGKCCDRCDRWVGHGQGPQIYFLLCFGPGLFSEGPMSLEGQYLLDSFMAREFELWHCNSGSQRRCSHAPRARLCLPVPHALISLLLPPVPPQGGWGCGAPAFPCSISRRGSVQPWGMWPLSHFS
jgi:hypothetical protein